MNSLLINSLIVKCQVVSPFQIISSLSPSLESQQQKNVQIKDKKSENKILRQPFFFSFLQQGSERKILLQRPLSKSIQISLLQGSLFFSLSVLLTLSLSLSICLTLSLSRYLSISLYLSFSLYLSLSVSVSLSLSSISLFSWNCLYDDQQ